MNQSEKDAVDASRLDNRKKERYTEIDSRTDALIAQGFMFAGKNFSLSANAQMKMMGINQIRDDVAVTYPIVWNTKNDTDSYDIPNSATVRGFYLTAVGTYRAHVDTGSALKAAVRAATSIEAVDAIVDNR